MISRVASNGVRVNVYPPVSFGRLPRGIARFGVVMMSGAGGGTAGPGAVYPELGERFAAVSDAPIISAAMDYRKPSHMAESVEDAVQVLKLLKKDFGVEKAILIGWSFGGGVVVSTAGQVNATLAARSRSPSPTSTSPISSPSSAASTTGTASSSSSLPQVIGLITVGTQTAGTSAIKTLNYLNPSFGCLLFHGAHDTCLNSACSRQLYRDFGGQDKELVIYEGDNHGCTLHREEMMTKIVTWSINRFTGQTAGEIQAEHQAVKNRLTAGKIPGEGSIINNGSSFAA